MSPPKAKQLLIWAILAACPSILMVADTSFLTENIAPHTHALGSATRVISAVIHYPF
ncbi:hypothetical protein [Polynucleobacter necessarius]|uniref:hypothetical protein n=1 Tax=Polynucleobacter necessarius TaxID=576610 RepID=UPI0013B0676C|nr:hypothetical protein [Polynucleobacter necessarius]